MERRPNQTRRSSSSTTTPTSRPSSRFYSSRFRASDQWSNENYDPLSGGGARAIDEAYQPNEGLFDRERATHFLFDGGSDSLSDISDDLNHESDQQLGQRCPTTSNPPGQPATLSRRRPSNHLTPSDLSTPAYHQQNPVNRDPNLTALLQHQQAMLQKLLAQQDMISEKQKAMDQRILSIEGKLSTSTSIDSSPGSSESSGKRTRVTRDLTVSEINPIRVYGDYII